MENNTVSEIRNKSYERESIAAHAAKRLNEFTQPETFCPLTRKACNKQCVCF